MKPTYQSVMLTGCGAFLAVAFLVLAWLSDGVLTIPTWLTIWCVASTVCFVAWRSAEKLTAAELLPRLWLIAVLLRMCGFFGPPIFEDDWYRYLWDGRQFATTGNPYNTAPRAHFADETVPDSFQPILSNLNHPDVPTIYGPVCQVVFALSYWIAPAQLWPLKLLLIAADLLTLWLLLKITSPRNALLYAWCPLVIQEISFTAHVEILGVMFVVAALLARARNRVVLTGILCGCAVAARIHAVLLLPFLLWPWRERGIGACIGTVVCFYAPFWWQGSAADWAGLKAFLGEWEFNSSLFALVKAATGWRFAKAFCALLFLGIAGALFVRFIRKTTNYNSNETFAAYALLLLGIFFALSAVVNPWYLLWLAPFVAVRPSLAAAVAMAAVSLSYIHGGTLDALGLPPYEHPKWLRPLEYGFILAAAWCDWRRNLLTAKRQTD